MTSTLSDWLRWPRGFLEATDRSGRRPNRPPMPDRVGLRVPGVMVPAMRCATSAASRWWSTRPVDGYPCGIPPSTAETLT